MKTRYRRFIISLIVLLSLTGCVNKKDYKMIEIRSNNMITTVKYDKNKFEATKYNNGMLLKNYKNNFRMSFEYLNITDKKTQKKESFKRSKNFKIVDNIKINKFKGYAVIDKLYGNVQLFLTKKKTNKVLYINITPIKIDDTKKYIKHKNNYKVLYNNQEVNNVLKSIRVRKIN